MSPSTAVTTCLTKYADFSGRAPRSEYWWFFLATVVVAAVLEAVPGNVGATLSVVGGLVLLVPGLSAGARRLHDTGRSGWWQLIVLVPLLGLIVLVVWLASEGEPVVNAYGSPLVETVSPR